MEIIAHFIVLHCLLHRHELPPSYEEAMGMLANHGGASSQAANHMPGNLANQRQPGNQNPIAVATPGGGNLYYLDFIPHLDFQRTTETFRLVICSIFKSLLVGQKKNFQVAVIDTWKIIQ